MNYFFFALIFPLTCILSLLIFQQWIVMPAISIVGVCLLILLYVFAYWMQEIVSSNLNETSSLLTKTFSWNDGAIQVSKLGISNFTLLYLPNFPFFVILIMVSDAVVSFLELCTWSFYLDQILFIAKYYHDKIQSIYNKKVLIDCIVIGIAFLVFMIPDPLIVDNILVFHAVLFIFSCYTLNVYLEHRNTNMTLSLPSELKTEAEALTYILEMIKVATKKHPNPALKVILIHNHLQQCE